MNVNFTNKKQNTPELNKFCLKRKIFPWIWIISLQILISVNISVAQQSGIITLLGKVSLPGNLAFDVWGVEDAASGKEYAVVGSGGISIFDVTDPSSPIQVTHITQVPSFDIKVWQNHLFVGSGGDAASIVINIADISNPKTVGYFLPAHNIFIVENGYMYTEWPMIFIYDLNLTPINPVPIWSGGTEGHDAFVRGNRLYDFHGTPGTNIYDVTNPSIPQLLGTIIDPQIQYHHSGSVSEDGHYLFICDEQAIHPTPDITVWDITDPTNPKKVSEYADPNATSRNLYIIGNYAYASYYTAGFRVFDVSDPTQIAIAAEYDTNPLSGEGIGGAFGVYPFTSSGHIYISDDTGLYIFAFDSTITNSQNPLIYPPRFFVLYQNYPNPFNPSTTIKYQIPELSFVTIKIFDVLGSEVATLVNEEKPIGSYEVEFNATQLPSGIYFYQLRAGVFAETKKMILLK